MIVLHELSSSKHGDCEVSIAGSCVSLLEEVNALGGELEPCSATRAATLSSMMSALLLTIVFRPSAWLRILTAVESSLYLVHHERPIA